MKPPDGENDNESFVGSSRLNEFLYDEKWSRRKARAADQIDCLTIPASHFSKAAPQSPSLMQGGAVEIEPDAITKISARLDGIRDAAPRP